MGKLFWKKDPATRDKPDTKWRRVVQWANTALKAVSAYKT